MPPLQREIKALVSILADETNVDKLPEDIAEELIEALDALRREMTWTAAVCQVRWPDSEGPSTFVLGPFRSSAPAVARRAAEAAVGGPHQDHTGRFMVVPAMPSVRAALDFCKPPNKAREAALTAILADVERWEAGRWAQEGHHGPVCHCGARTLRPCPVHGRGGK